MTQPRPASGPDGSAARWRAVRRALNENRQALTATAARLHGDVPRVAGTGLLCWPGWLPAEPLDLAGLPLSWSGEPPPPAVDGTLPAAAHVLPRQACGLPYPAYADAIGALDRPALFENRACYRLLSAAGEARPGLCFTGARYFDAVNVGHAVAHELAAAWAGGRRMTSPWPDCRCAPRSVTPAICAAGPRSPR